MWRILYRTDPATCLRSYRRVWVAGSLPRAVATASLACGTLGLAALPLALAPAPVSGYARETVPESRVPQAFRFAADLPLPDSRPGLSVCSLRESASGVAPLAFSEPLERDGPAQPVPVGEPSSLALLAFIAPAFLLLRGTGRKTARQRLRRGGR